MTVYPRTPLRGAPESFPLTETTQAAQHQRRSLARQIPNPAVIARPARCCSTKLPPPPPPIPHQIFLQPPTFFPLPVIVLIALPVICTCTALLHPLVLLRAPLSTVIFFSALVSARRVSDRTSSTTQQNPRIPAAARAPSFPWRYLTDDSLSPPPGPGSCRGAHLRAFPLVISRPSAPQAPHLHPKPPLPPPTDRPTNQHHHHHHARSARSPLHSNSQNKKDDNKKHPPPQPSRSLARRCMHREA